jgi:hypothetical protein
MPQTVSGLFQVVDSTGKVVFVVDPDSTFRQIVYQLPGGGGPLAAFFNACLLELNSSVTGHTTITLDAFGGPSGGRHVEVRADPGLNAIIGVGSPGKIGVQGLGSGDNGFGVVGIGTGGAPGVSGNTDFGAGTGIHGHTSAGVGVLGTSGGTGPAGRFEGNVQITQNLSLDGGFSANGVSIFENNVLMHGDVICNGNIIGNQNAAKTTITCFDVILGGGDCAEDFDVQETTGIEPGMVMVIDMSGTLRPCDEAYDKRVAGVISGAGDYKPGIVLDKRDSGSNRQPIALFGKVYCKVDANCSAIEIGDLLTTSPTIGHAMRAQDPSRAFGTVIGKALGAMSAGTGSIPMLISLQ